MFKVYSVTALGKAPHLYFEAWKIEVYMVW